MKKIIILALVAGIALVALIAVAFFYLGPITKSAVERVGPQVTKVSVKLDSAVISLFNGSGTLKGFVLGNPDGFKTSQAVKVGSIGVSVVPRSVLSKKVIVRRIEIQGPEITYEAGLGGSNIGKILDNIKSVASAEKSGQTNTSSSKALQVDEFIISGGKIGVSTSMLGGQSASLSLPDIRLTGLGEGPDGITAAELSAKAFGAIVDATAKAVAGNAANLGKAATDAAQNVGTEAADRLKKASSGISDLLKTKKP